MLAWLGEAAGERRFRPGLRGVPRPRARLHAGARGALRRPLRAERAPGRRRAQRPGRGRRRARRRLVLAHGARGQGCRRGVRPPPGTRRIRLAGRGARRLRGLSGARRALRPARLRKPRRGFERGHVAVTGLWSLVALALVEVGGRLPRPGLSVAGLGLIAFTALKTIGYDHDELASGRWASLSCSSPQARCFRASSTSGSDAAPSCAARRPERSWRARCWASSGWSSSRAAPGTGSTHSAGRSSSWRFRTRGSRRRPSGRPACATSRRSSGRSRSRSPARPSSSCSRACGSSSRSLSPRRPSRRSPCSCASRAQAASALYLLTRARLHAGSRGSPARFRGRRRTRERESRASSSSARDDRVRFCARHEAPPERAPFS